MQNEGLLRLSYWGGWASAGVALVYKLLIAVGVLGAEQVVEMQVFPRHFWQASFLLFLICLATDAYARRKSA